MPKSRKTSDLIPVYQGKGDVKSCGSYRSTKLLVDGIKVIQRIFEKRLRKVVLIDQHGLTTFD